MNNNPLLELKALGQHIWLDNLSRTLLREGGLQRLINEDGVDGITSNPAIFEKAINGSTYYRDDLERLRSAGMDAEGCYEGRPGIMKISPKSAYSSEFKSEF